ncbi:MAG: hypothetical protein AAB834_04360, partial [Patescibacteria group bacterium]
MLSWKTPTQKKLEALQDRHNKIAPYADLARDIATKIGAETLTDEQYTTALAELEAKERKRRLVESLGAMPLNRQYALLARTYNDVGLRLALEAQHEAAQRRVELKDRVEELARDGSEQGYVDLTRIPPRATATLGLYGVYDLVDAGGDAKAMLEGHEPDRILRVAAREQEGQFWVVYDLGQAGARGLRPNMDPQDTLRLGSLRQTVGEERTIEPLVYPGG